MKFFTRLFVAFFNVFVFTNFAAFGVPVLRDSKTNQKYFHSVDQQNINAILTSIDIRLQNLDHFCSLHSSTIQSKLAYYERKLDKMEKEMLRIEMRIKLDLDKVSENISNKNFRDDITADRIIKKIDSAFDRVSNKYAVVESNMDLIATKIQNTRDVITEKLDKIDEVLYIRDEENAAEMEGAIEDLKKVCSSVEDKLFNKTEGHIKSLSNQTKISVNGHPSEDFQYGKLLYENSSIGNKSFSNCGQIETALDRNKADIEISINEFTNKVTDMKYNLDEALAGFKSSLEKVVLLVNETKREQQNNFHELRAGDKNSNKYASDNEELTEINNKLDKHFKRLISAQNSFSENCYKLQMDESQIETKISFILENMNETFKKKMEDITKLENSLFVHDMYIRRHFYELARKINILSKKVFDDRTNTTNAIYTIKQFMHEEHEILEEMLQNLQNTINKTFISHNKTENTLLMVNENLKNIFKVPNNNTITSLNCVDLELTFNGTDNKNKTDTIYITNDYSTIDTFFNYTTEATTFPDVDFPIDIRFGTDDSTDTTIKPDNSNVTIQKNNTGAKINNTFPLDLGSYSTQDLNLTEPKTTPDGSSNNQTVKLLPDLLIKTGHDKGVSDSQEESVDENIETYLTNKSDYDLEMVESTLNSNDHIDRSGTDNENQDNEETLPQMDELDIFAEWLRNDSI